MLSNFVPMFWDWWSNGTKAGRAARDGGDILEGVKQDLTETKENIEENSKTFLTKDNALMRPFIELGENSIRFWDEFWKGQKEAQEWDLGDHVTADEVKDFVENGGELTVQPETAVIQPDENWSFGDDASIEDIMNWMKTRNGGSLGPGEALDAGVRTGLYAGISAAQMGENLTSQDIAEFTKVPDAMKAAVAAGVSGIKVSLDGRAVGQMVAPYVSVLIAADILGLG